MGRLPHVGVQHFCQSEEFVYLVGRVEKEELPIFLLAAFEREFESFLNDLKNTKFFSVVAHCPISLLMLTLYSLPDLTMKNMASRTCLWSSSLEGSGMWILGTK